MSSASTSEGAVTFTLVLHRAEDRAAPGQRLGERRLCLPVHDRLLAWLRQPEIQQFGPALREHDVAGLHVAVDDPSFVGGSQRIGDLNPVLEGLVDRQLPACEPGGEGLALQVPSRGSRSRSGGQHRTAANVRMGEHRHGAGLAFEPLPGSRIAGQLSREHLDGDRAVEACVARPVQFAHAA
jgi:hypothetical protein